MSGNHVWILSAVLVTAACDGGGATDGGPPDALDGGADGGAVASDAGASDSGRDAEPADACTPITVDLARDRPPVDFVLVADSSASMSEELAAIESTLESAFADPLGALVDLQIILVADHGAGSYELCIQGELAGGVRACTGAPGDVEGRFHHYDVSVQSHDAACVLLDTYGGPADGGEPDEHGLHPDGWSSWLREEAFKVFLVVGDDNMSCAWRGVTLNDADDVSGSPTGSAAQAAQQLDAALTGLDAAQLGTVGDRRYVMHALIGLAPRAGGGPYPADEPIVSTDCLSAVSPGPGHQWMAKGTGGLRSPSCEHASYADFFGSLVTDTADRAPASCRFTPSEPVAPAHEVIRYDGGEIPRLADAAACAGGGGFYVQGEQIVLCPASCEATAEAGGFALQAPCP